MGGYKPVLKKITILGRLNDINLQAEFEIEYDPEQIRFMTMLSDFTEKLRLGGLQPPVGKSQVERKWSDNATRATGEHPLDNNMRVNDTLQPVLCPVCQKPQKIVEGIAKTGPNVGNKWVKAICSNEKSCTWTGEFINSRKVK
jgi:hypothetical protein